MSFARTLLVEDEWPTKGRSQAQISHDIQAELLSREEYRKQHPSGDDGTGGFYCGTKLNLLYAELGSAIGIDPEEAKKLIEGSRR